VRPYTPPLAARGAIGHGLGADKDAKRGPWSARASSPYVPVVGYHRYSVVVEEIPVAPPTQRGKRAEHGGTTQAAERDKDENARRGSAAVATHAAARHSLELTPKGRGGSARSGYVAHGVESGRESQRGVARGPIFYADSLRASAAKWLCSLGSHEESVSDL
jgi:hypothetical protein